MAKKKKQQTIEATLGHPVLRPKAPQRPTSKASSDQRIPPGNKVQSWLNTIKTGGSRGSSTNQAPPSSSFMPRSSTRKRVRLSESSSSAEEASGLDDHDTTPKRATPGKAVGKRQSHLALRNVNPGSPPHSGPIVVADDDEDAELSGSDDLPVATPNRKLKLRGKRKAVSDESDDSDVAPIATPRVARPGARARRPQPTRDECDEDEDEDLPPISSMFSKRSRRSKRAHSEEEDGEDGNGDDDVVVPSTKRRRLIRRSSPVAAPGNGRKSSPPAISSPIKRTSKSRSEKDKRRELLRRRRAGENITMEDLETSDDEEAHALYDTDSEHVALDEFEDDEEGVLQPEPVTKSKKAKGKKPTKDLKTEDSLDPSDDEAGEEDMKDFIEDDDEGTLGIPGELVEIPLEFTRHARKPLKEHFRDVVEWLVRFNFEPNFEDKHNELYMIGWMRLDDEVAGLASSKFASSAWKPEFRRALNARPKFVSVELPKGDMDRLFGTCEACGRSGHPATWTVSFQGAPYYRKNKRDPHFLEDVESDDDTSSSSSSNSDSNKPPEPSRDEDGNELPPESRQWSVGSVCQSNAETAHTLIHWKHDLLEWVSARLENDGHLTPAQIAARTKMKRKKRNKAVEAIIAAWDRQRVIEELYRDFEGVLEEARNKSTTGRGGGRWH